MAQTKEGADKVCAIKAGISVEQYREFRTSGLKWCWKCKGWSGIEKYCKDSKRSDGLSSVCNACRNKHHGKSKSEIQKEIWQRRFSGGYVSPMKGRRFPPEFGRKLSQAFKGRPKQSPMLGKTHSIETNIKISRILRERARRGKECRSYKDGKLAERRGLRFSIEYKRWRFDVFVRYNFMCQMCREFRYGQLVAHHIRSFANHPALRFDVNNGVTVCKDCHSEIHSIRVENE